MAIQLGGDSFETWVGGLIDDVAAFRRILDMYEPKSVHPQRIKNLRVDFLTDLWTRCQQIVPQIFERRCINGNIEQNVREGCFLGFA